MWSVGCEIIDGPSMWLVGSEIIDVGPNIKSCYLVKERIIWKWARITWFDSLMIFVVTPIIRKLKISDSDIHYYLLFYLQSSGNMDIKNIQSLYNGHGLIDFCQDLFWTRTITELITSPISSPQGIQSWFIWPICGEYSNSEAVFTHKWHNSTTWFFRMRYLGIDWWKEV